MTNYAVIYEYAVDTDGSQFQAPFDQIKNEPCVYTYRDAAIISANSGESRAIRAKLASIGISPRKTFDFKDLSPEHKAAFIDGMKAGDAQVSKFLAEGTKKVNNWHSPA